METIIGLLFVLLPVILSFIGKKLENSGKEGTARKLRELTGDFMDEDLQPADPRPVMQPSDPRPVMQPSAPRPAIQPADSRPAMQKIARPKEVRKPILPEEEKKTAEKIDSKKLIIYSEIMTPKWNQN